MRKTYWALALMASVVSIADSAAAFTGHVSRTVNLRAGPGVEYPVVSRLGSGAAVEISGCIEGWNWCDIEVGPYHGWVSGNYLRTNYNRRPVYIMDAGPRMDVPIITFNSGTYWDRHYRDRSFYRDRGRWDRHDRDNDRHDWKDRRDDRRDDRWERRDDRYRGRDHR